MLKKIISFGFKYGHPDGGVGQAIVDLRPMFQNPYRNPLLRDKIGTDPAVEQEIRKTPNFHAKYNYLRECITTPGIEVVYLGCTGGRHRSVFLAERLAQELGVTVEHRDLEKAHG